MTIAQINRSAPKPRLAHDLWLGRQSDAELFQRLRHHGDPRAREELIRRHLGLAQRLAQRYLRDGVFDDDMLQVASFALVKAIDRYDPSRGTKFSSLAVPTILGELKRHLRDHGWGMHVPRRLQEQALVVARAVEELTGQLGRAPSPAEIAQRVRLSVEQVLEALEASRARTPDRLDAPMSDEVGTAIVESVGSLDPYLDAADSRNDMQRAVAALSECERELVRLRFFEDLTQTEIAARMGISQMHVSRLLRRALNRAHAATRG